MKLSEGIKLEGKFVRIPEGTRDELPELFKERGYRVGAEVGVLNGDFTEKFCAAGMKMYAVDSWTISEDYYHVKGQGFLDNYYEEVKRKLAPYDCTLIRKTSMDAAKDFEDNSLDFVYIDANHHFKYVAEDLVEWTKKVKKGGIVSGHDFFYSNTVGNNAIHVRWVVEAFANTYGFKLYALGNNRSKDKWPSWMFIKGDYVA